jgi:hypothetical protein
MCYVHDIHTRLIQDQVPETGLKHHDHDDHDDG